ncbi:hypothetical protein c7_R1304 [Megavirus courdo7]|uniref:Uncharacterized protein n=1 Tax=Megavirus courdo7 TaxID=1128135 RepID=H2ECP3_9VIRU|nr:hypothetical protein c7_R1304 [Megavirus courdo7]
MDKIDLKIQRIEQCQEKIAQLEKKIKDREIVVSKKDNIITGPTEENKIDHNIIHETKKGN